MRFTIYTYNDSWDRFFARELRDGLNELGPGAEIVHKHRLPLTEDSDAIYRSFKRCLIIYDNNNSIYHVLNHHDKPYSFMPFEGWLHRPDFGLVLQCQYRADWKQDNIFGYPHQIVPFTYLEQDPDSYRERRGKLLRNTQTEQKPLVFRGTYDEVKDGRRRRKLILNELAKYDIMIPDWSEKISEDDFYKEIASSRMILCLPGNGNLCHRELECFGVKTVAFMPRLLNSYYSPLIPDFHYISVDVDWEVDKSDHIAFEIFRKYDEIKDKDEYLNFVAANGLRWYEENVLYPASAKIFIKILKDFKYF